MTTAILAGAVMMTMTPQVASAAESNGGVKVMPLGDSITYGGGDGGYRTRLWQNLQNGGYTVDFVGSQNVGPTSLGDRDNEGHSGYSISGIDDNIVTWLAAATPQTILLQIGTNDAIGNGDAEFANAPTRLSNLLDKIKSNAPDAHVFVAKITPLTAADKDARVRTYNDAIPDIVAAKGSKFHVVDMYSAVNKSDLGDGVHPNPTGFNSMGDAWYQALIQVPGSIGASSNSTTGTEYQAESAGRAGGAKVNTDHTGYTGTGFVDGYGSTGASTTFDVTAASAGSHDVTLRYANGPYPAAQAKKISLYVNGTKVKQISLASTASWDIWANHKETVTLTSGANTIMYKVDSGDDGHVNLDKITVEAVAATTASTTLQAENATRAGSAGVNTDHNGYRGTGFVDGYWSTGASTTFSVTAAAAGSHDVTLRYSNGGYPTVGAKTVSLYVNGSKVKQISLAATANWNTWADHKETVTLTSGANSIAYKVDSGDSGFVNLDEITVIGNA